ncbi:PD-(D/E)XK nuclease family protein [Nocardia sp. CC216A]|uniref:PD-(D/E)XK nuclease family protein n=1 Tax=Nocardia sp. CC216A TaxID=3044158 RepID=UPI00355860ED
MRLVRRVQTASHSPEWDADVRELFDGVGPEPGWRPWQVLGGPGTGKTALLVDLAATRISAGEDPESVLVLTYSKRAATAVRNALTLRIAALAPELGGVPGATRAPLVRTVHSYAFGMLRTHAAAHGNPPPRLLTGSEQDIVLRELLRGELLDGAKYWPERLHPALPTGGFAEQLRDLMLRATERGLGPEDLVELGRTQQHPEWVAAGRFAERYEQTMLLRWSVGMETPEASAPALDAAELVGAALDALVLDPELLAAERDRVRHLLVDDAQHLDPQAAQLVRAIGSGPATTVIAADPDQSVFTFRGADARFAADPGAPEDRRVILRDNHRSAPAIQEALARITARLPGTGVHRTPPVALRVVAAPATEPDAARDSAPATTPAGPATDRVAAPGTDRAAGPGTGWVAGPGPVGSAGSAAATDSETNTLPFNGIPADRDVGARDDRAAASDAAASAYPDTARTADTGAGHRAGPGARESGRSGDIPAPEGEVRVHVLTTPAKEAALIADHLRRAHLTHGVPWSRMAVIVRSIPLSLAPLRRALLAAGVPVRQPPPEVPLARRRGAAWALLTLRAIMASDPSRHPGPRPDAFTADDALDLLAGPLGGADQISLRRLRRGIRRSVLELGHPTRRAEPDADGNASAPDDSGFSGAQGNGSDNTASRDAESASASTTRRGSVPRSDEVAPSGRAAALAHPAPLAQTAQAQVGDSSLPSDSVRDAQGGTSEGAVSKSPLSESLVWANEVRPGAGAAVSGGREDVSVGQATGLDGAQEAERFADLDRSSAEILRDLIIGVGDRAILGRLTDVESAPLRRVLKAVGRGRAARRRGEGLEETLWAVWTASSLERRWVGQSERGGAVGMQADRDLDAVVGLFEAAGAYVDRLPHATVEGFVEYLEQQEIPQDGAPHTDPGEAVTIVSAHGAAGREWDTVAVAGVQEGIWPNLRPRGTLLGVEELVDVIAGVGDTGERLSRAAPLLAEERRLLLVACGRARRSLLVTAVESVTGDQDLTPSRFLAELDADTDHGAPGRIPAPVDPGRALAMHALIAELRGAVCDPDSDPDRADRAARQLARLAAAGVRGAHPDEWYGTADLSSGHPLWEIEDGAVGLSPSTVDQLKTCPLRWALERHGGQDGDNVHALKGNLVHTLVQALAGQVDEAQVKAALAKAWKKVDPSSREGENWHSRQELRRTETMVDTFLAWLRNTRDELTALGVEVPIDLTLPARGPDELPVRIKGRVDRVERDALGRFVIVDVKTGKTPISKQAAEDHAQLATYQVAAAEGALGDGEPGGARLVYVAKPSSREGATQRAQPPLDEAGIDRWRGVIHDAAAATRGPSYLAMRNDGCRHCKVSGSCPVQDTGRQVTDE